VLTSSASSSTDSVLAVVVLGRGRRGAGRHRLPLPPRPRPRPHGCCLARRLLSGRLFSCLGGGRRGKTVEALLLDVLGRVLQGG
jgi:hypothetical protein